MKFHSEGSIQELVKTIETQRGKPDMTGFTGNIDDSGFRFFRMGGFSRRSFIFVFKGLFRQDGERITVELSIRPHLTEALIFLAIEIVCIIAAAKPPFGLFFGVAAFVFAGVYALLGWFEWRALRRLLERSGCSKLPRGS